MKGCVPFVFGGCKSLICLLLFLIAGATACQWRCEEDAGCGRVFCVDGNERDGDGANATVTKKLDYKVDSLCLGDRSFDKSFPTFYLLNYTLDMRLRGCGRTDSNHSRFRA